MSQAPTFSLYIYITIQVSKIVLSQQYIYILYIHDYTYIIIYIFFTENILHDITCIHISFTYILHLKHTWLYIHNHTHIYVYIYMYIILHPFLFTEKPTGSLRISPFPPWGHHPPRRDVVAEVHRGDGPVHGDPNHRGRGRPLAIPGPWEKMGQIYGKITGKHGTYSRNMSKYWQMLKFKKLESEKVYV